MQTDRVVPGERDVGHAMRELDRALGARGHVASVAHRVSGSSPQPATAVRLGLDLRPEALGQPRVAKPDLAHAAAFPSISSFFLFPHSARSLGMADLGASFAMLSAIICITSASVAARIWLMTFSTS
jgi:hypothetical protein